MPKKVDKNTDKKKEIQIVDEQKEPCLRALQKKVRNINKKLGEIADLQGKPNLKPEQIDKIERKEQHLQEKDKYMEFIGIYKQIAKQNAKVIRSNQLNELKEIATVLAARQYGAHLKLPENQDLNNLVKILASPSSLDLSLSQRVEQLIDHLIKVANNTGLKKTYLNFFAQNQDLVVFNENFSNQPQPRSNKSEENRDEVIQDIDEELQQIDELTGEQHIIVEPHIGNPSHHTVQEVQSRQVDQKIEQKHEEVKSLEVEENIEAEKQEAHDKEKNRGYRRNIKKQNYQKGREGKKNYVPKNSSGQHYRPKQHRSDSSSSQNSSPEVRGFKREERKKLEEDGFIFIDKKTKPRARDQKQWHDKQHGNKHHHYHGPKNS